MALQIANATISMRSLYAVVHDDGNIPRGQELMSKILSAVEDFLLVTNNTVTDSLLIYRCYVIWGTSRYKKNMVVLPLLLTLSTAVVGYLTAYFRDPVLPESHFDSRILFGLVFGTNLLLTSLTVGRIWWTRRNLQAIGQTMLEASALYLIGVTLLLIGYSFKNSSTASVWTGFDGQLGVRVPVQSWKKKAHSHQNIIPALMVVQLSLSRKTDDEAVAQSNLSSV
ncbi:hypothetical protein B0H17DRAFT_1296227 [Mycena rosella]|uniref:Uncharacterized protein n=1 Tax=Mycena rosella TaxID=1033263 RepID=A0AAD7GHD9_MYCRO|nr:hypothetical protein B0H17DRAFT_1296227 [Mycena rosella]